MDSIQLGKVIVKQNDLLIGVRFGFYIPFQHPIEMSLPTISECTDKKNDVVWVSPAVFKLISDDVTPNNSVIQKLVVRFMPKNEDNSHKYSSLEYWIDAIINNGEDILCKTGENKSCLILQKNNVKIFKIH